MSSYYSMPSPAKFGNRALDHVFLTMAASDTELARYGAAASPQPQPPDISRDNELTRSPANIGDQALHDDFMATAEADTELAIYAAIDDSLTTSQQSEVDQNGVAADVHTSRSHTYPIYQRGSENITGFTRPHATATNITANNNITQGWMTNTILPPMTPTIAFNQPAVPGSYALGVAGRYATNTSPGLRQQGFEPLNQVTHSLPVEQPLSTAAGAERGTQSPISNYCPSASRTQGYLSAPTSTASYTNNSCVNDSLPPTGHLNLAYSSYNQHSSAFSGTEIVSPSPYALTLTAEYFISRGIPAPQGNTPYLSELSSECC